MPAINAPSTCDAPTKPMTGQWAARLETPLGILTVWANERAITKLDWVDTVPPEAADRPGNAITDQALSALSAYFAPDEARGDVTALDHLPVAPAVTPFRQQILTAMRQIPAGQVHTYGDLAKAAGVSPGAVRAGGSACATNPIPIIIPCHRVVAAGGKMGGFSGLGGLDTKQWLLHHEGWAPHTPRLL